MENVRKMWPKKTLAEGRRSRQWWHQILRREQEGLEGHWTAKEKVSLAFLEPSQLSRGSPSHSRLHGKEEDTVLRNLAVQEDGACHTWRSLYSHPSSLPVPSPFFNFKKKIDLSLFVVLGKELVD